MINRKHLLCLKICSGNALDQGVVVSYCDGVGGARRTDKIVLVTEKEGEKKKKKKEGRGWVVGWVGGWVGV